MKGNLLIVDDEPLLLKNLKANLEDCADEIHVAGNGKEALEVLAHQTIHCIVCDINMPTMNGVELIKAIRKAENNVPFIFFTGHGNKDLMLEAIKYGAFDFLNKPHFEGLEDVVTRGINFGLNKVSDGILETDVLSEYQQMLKEINK